jgi:hypothetical protein
MRKLIIPIILFAFSAYSQVKEPYSLKEHMILKSAEEQQLFAKDMLTSTKLFLCSGAAYWIATTPESNRVFYFIGGTLAVTGAYFAFRAPVHLKRSGMYLEASVTGVRVVF